MEIKEIRTKENMLLNFELLKEVYPSLTLNSYSDELDTMLPHNYGQVGVFAKNKCIAMTGYWIGSKLWCGKYMELDNVVVSKEYRSQGIGEKLFSYMEKMAFNQKCTMLALDTYTDNFKAHKFFFDQGYIPRGFHFIHILDKSKIR